MSSSVFCLFQVAAAHGVTRAGDRDTAVGRAAGTVTRAATEEVRAMAVAAEGRVTEVAEGKAIITLCVRPILFLSQQSLLIHSNPPPFSFYRYGGQQSYWSNQSNNSSWGYGSSGQGYGGSSGGR